MWYILDACKDKTWKDGIIRHTKIVNDKRNSMMKRIRPYAILVVADTLDQKTILLLREAYGLYSQCMKKELSIAGMAVSDYKYKSSDTRDLFMFHLPLILVYGKDGAYLVKKNETIDWDSLIKQVEWPHKNTLINKTVNEKLTGLIPKALKFSSTAADRNIIKTIMTSITSIDHVSKGGLGLEFNRQCLKRAVSDTMDSIEKYDTVSSTSNFSGIMLKKEKSKTT